MVTFKASCLVWKESDAKVGSHSGEVEPHDVTDGGLVGGENDPTPLSEVPT